MKRLLPRLLTVVLVAAIAVIGSVAGRAVWDAVTGQEQPEARPPPWDVLEESAAKPPFGGEILDVYIAPSGSPVPDEFTTFEKVCGTLATVEVPWDKAGDLKLEFTLPEPFQLVPDSMNTGVISCGDTVYAARWEYSLAQPNGYPGSITVARGRFGNQELEVAADRIETTEIGGLPAIYIKPLSPSGVSSSAAIIFPGEGVVTEIQSGGVPETELLKVAEAVAAAIKGVGR
jgi:hypothetical protein